MKFRETTFRVLSDTGEGPSEDWAPNGARVRVPVAILPGTPESRGQAVEDFLGQSFIKPPVTIGQPLAYVSRILPYGYPSSFGSLANPLGNAWLWAYSLTGGRGQGVGREDPEGNGQTYPQYRYELECRTRPYQLLADADVLAQGGPANGLPDEGDCLRRGYEFTRFITKQVKGATRLVTMLGSTLRFKSDSIQPIFSAAPVYESIAHVWYTQHLLPRKAVPRGAIASTVNCINDDDFDGWKKGTLMLLDHSEEEQQGALGDILTTLTLRFSWKPALDTLPSSLTYNQQLGHNAFLRARNKVYTYDSVVVMPDGTNPPFASRDFTDLFRPTHPWPG